MLWKLWDVLFGNLRDWKYWPVVQPYVLVALAGIVAEVLAYQFVTSQYGVTPTPGLFLRSYLSVRIAMVCAAAMILILLFSLERGREDGATPGRVAAFVQQHRWTIVYRTSVTLVVVAATAVALLIRSPSRVGHIAIKFMGPPDEVRSVVAYLAYELNRVQRQWHFDVDFVPFNELSLSSSEAERCRADPDDPLLCYAEQIAGGRGLVVAITDRALNRAYFATHRARASVITTADASSYAPLTVYEYLAYSIVLQSMLLHLDESGGLPGEAFAPGSSSAGDIFQFAPERDALKSTILAARLSPEEEALILNRFGPEYLGLCASLISLDWLYSPRVRTNLDKMYGVTLSR